MTAATWTDERRSILGNAMGVGVAAGAYAIGFGALGVATGLTLAQTMALSLLMFTGASQFALVGVVGAGGGGVAAALTALMLGLRNALYGLRMAPLLDARGLRRWIAAQFTIDESTAMALARDEQAWDGRGPKLAFWATGLSIYLWWNGCTLIGALGAGALGDPKDYGLDAVIPAAFLALLWPRLKGRDPWAIAMVSALVALLLTPVLRPGLPVLAAALVAVIAGLRSGHALEPLAAAARDAETGARDEDGAAPGGGPA